MNTLPFLEKAEAYLHAHLPHPERGENVQPLASYVTISRDAREDCSLNPSSKWIR